MKQKKIELDNKKYSGYNQNDTNWDDYHKQNNMMTNREFFSSNAKGGFYEGMEWDGNSWIPKERQANYESQRCSECGLLSCICW
jgi:hypothetical protein